GCDGEEEGGDSTTPHGLDSRERQLDGALLTQPCELVIEEVFGVVTVQPERGEASRAWRTSGHEGEVEPRQGITCASQLQGRDQGAHRRIESQWVGCRSAIIALELRLLERYVPCARLYSNGPDAETAQTR